MLKTVNNSRVLIAALAVTVSCAVVTPSQAGAGNVGNFAPHRAVYDITLDRSKPGSAVEELSGRMVYELQGSKCEGYTQNMRFVTRTTGSDGSRQVNDLRTSSWEEADGKRLRFQSSQYRDSALAATTQGDAERNAPKADKAISGSVRVQLEKPNSKGLALKGKIYFPMQHSHALLDAARNGRRIFKAKVYDGSDKGEKVYSTSAFIGSKVSGKDTGAESDFAERHKLAPLPAWPISISYFEPGSTNVDAVPAYELSFRFYDNGVSSKLRIDYGNFAIRGKLSELQFLEATDCSH